MPSRANAAMIARMGLHVLEHRLKDLVASLAVLQLEDARRVLELLELVDCVSRAITDADDLIDEIGRRQIDHALFASPQHFEAVVCLPDVAREERRRKTQHHVPTHGHDVGLAAPGRTDQYDGAGFEIPADLIERKITFPISAALHRRLRAWGGCRRPFGLARIRPAELSRAGEELRSCRSSGVTEAGGPPCQARRGKE